MKGIIAVFILLFTPFCVYQLFRPPKRLSPNVTGRSGFVTAISTYLLRPIMALGGAFLAGGFISVKYGYEQIAVPLFITATFLIMLLFIPGALCFKQFYQLEDK